MQFSNVYNYDIYLDVAFLRPIIINYPRSNLSVTTSLYRTFCGMSDNMGTLCTTRVVICSHTRARARSFYNSYFTTEAQCRSSNFGHHNLLH